VGSKNTLPRVGSVVLAVVRRVRSRQVEVGIVVVYGDGNFGDEREGLAVMGKDEGSVCADEWPAVLRKEDVRATEKEKVVCAEGFRVGDVVRGVVVCLSFSVSFSLFAVYTYGRWGDGKWVFGEWKEADVIMVCVSRSVWATSRIIT